MRWPKGSRKRRSYHHGNLKQALIEAALELIGDKGPAGFTFAEAARAAGVSPAAPYRHFSGREALIADVARDGFMRFANLLEEAWADAAPDPMSAMERVSKAYLGFARSEPAYFSAMFEAGLAMADHPELRTAADKAFAILERAAATLARRLPEETRPPARMMSLHIWSLAHGIASLFGRGDEGRRPLPVTPEELLEAGLLIYLQGAGLEGSGKPESHR
jgi:AcrR family transcriptional regulator